MISLRPLTPADAPLLSQIGKRSQLESHGHSAAPGIMQTYADKYFSEEVCRAQLSDNRNLHYGAHYEGQPAGYFKIILNATNAAVPLQPVTKMERLYLLKEFYGLQVGESLMRKALELSKMAGERGMWLNVWKGNPRAIRFYEKAGFTVVGEYDFFVTQTHINPNWVMFLAY